MLRTLLVLACLLVLATSQDTASEAPSTSSSSSVSSSTTSAPSTESEISTDGPGCICVPKEDCKDEEAAKERGVELEPPKAGVEVKCSSPDEICCQELIVRTEKTVETHSYYYRGARILNPDDGETAFGDHPWQALLYTDYEDIICAGTLISSKHVLTGATCVKKFQQDSAPQLKARLGEWDRESEDEPIPHENYDVKPIAVHPDFKYAGKNDIAVLELDREVAFSDHIQRLPLPREGDNFAGLRCLVSGWGENSENKTTPSRVLKRVEVPVLEDDKCQEFLRKTDLGQNFQLYNGSLCAGGEEGKDACIADAGGPLACIRQGEEKPVLAGIVSWGIGCGRKDTPGVYTSVGNYLDFVSSSTGLSKESLNEA